jgi:hypothetical protein
MTTRKAKAKARRATAKANAGSSLRSEWKDKGVTATAEDEAGPCGMRGKKAKLEGLCAT